MKTHTRQERTAQYLYLMILRKDTGADDQPVRIEDEVEIIRRLSRKVYKKLRTRKRGVKPGAHIQRYV